MKRKYHEEKQSQLVTQQSSSTDSQIDQTEPFCTDIICNVVWRFFIYLYNEKTFNEGEKKTHQSTCQNFQFPKRTASPALWRSLVERRYFHINTANYCHPSRGITCYRLTEIKGYWQVWVKENKRKVKKKNQDKWKNHFRKGILLQLQGMNFSCSKIVK